MKRIAFLGDSITEGVGASDQIELGYVGLLGKEENITAINYGISGTRIARQTYPSEKTRHDLDFPLRVDIIDPTVDYVFVFGGTNDYGHGDAKIGTIDSNDVFTFYGATKILCDKLIQKFGKEKIRFILPIHRSFENVKNESNNETLSTYKNIIKEILDIYKIEYLDLESVIPYQESQNYPLLLDGLHPNDQGHKAIKDYLLKYINTLK